VQIRNHLFAEPLAITNYEIIVAGRAAYKNVFNSVSYSRNLLRFSTNTVMQTLPALPSRIIRPISMFFSTRRLQPRDPILFKRLDPWLELGLLKFVVVDRSDARNTSARVPAAATVHERSTDAAEAVLHVVASRNCFVLFEAREFIFAAEMFHVGVFNDEVGCEHAERGVSKLCGVIGHVVFAGSVAYLAVILRQSVQWQMNVSTRPSPSVGTSI
jgi:hypothetical protein